MATRYELYPLGEQAVVVRWQGGIGEQMQQRVTQAVHRLEQNRIPAVTELVRAYRTVTVFYDPVTLYQEERRGRLTIPASGSKRLLDDEDGEILRSPYEAICVWIDSCLTGLTQAKTALFPSGPSSNEREVTIPVCFGGSYGPDLAALAERARLREDEAVALYCSVVYVVHMIGFVPGFPYLGGLPERLAAPRLDEPRMVVPAGSVGIAGRQTGIYPQAIPGGWQLIGRTPFRLFDAARTAPSLLRSGDRVIFQPVSEAEFEQLQEKEELR